jgi:hypothetical protein
VINVGYLIALAGAFTLGFLAVRWIFYRFVKQKVRVIIKHKDGSQTTKHVSMTDREVEHWRKTGKHPALSGLKPD